MQFKIHTIMNSATPNIQISQTFTQVSDFSVKKKRQQENLRVNEFLDGVLELQSEINEDCKFLENLVVRFEEISWIKLDSSNYPEALNLINAIISVTRDVHRLMHNRYIFLNRNAKKHASKEIKRLKTALDDIKEVNNDLEDVFINLPTDIDFQLANEKLQNL